MSYDSLDMVGDVQALLEEKGYRFENTSGDEVNRWTFGGHAATESMDGQKFDSCNSTFMGALKDCLDRGEELKAAARGVLAAWEKGDLAAATRLLSEAVDAMTPELVVA